MLRLYRLLCKLFSIYMRGILGIFFLLVYCKLFYHTITILQFCTKIIFLISFLGDSCVLSFGKQIVNIFRRNGQLKVRKYVMENIWQNINGRKTCVVLLMDVSCNTFGMTLDNIKGAVSRYVYMTSQVASQNGFRLDNLALLSFDDTSNLVCNFTTNYRKLIDQMESLHASQGQPCLGVGLTDALQLCKRERGSCALSCNLGIVIFTSGDSHYSCACDPREISKNCQQEQIRLSVVECNKRQSCLAHRTMLLEVLRLSGSNSICDDDNIHLLMDNNETSASTVDIQEYSDDESCIDDSDTEEYTLDALRTNLAFMIPALAIKDNYSAESNSTVVQEV
eukprot:TRINITY_DN4918_c0_g1_i3.p1 TRINITY_DN4918_c0_g1~~TRINITY_DN4918_c0_g1_i3.p1  ORF type:complete len:337 (+),score=8.90 TRINITY_DN4918_c0_g1_i3:22-1032(+)